MGRLTIEGLPQPLTASDCLPCQVCCRFAERDTSYRPYFRRDEIRDLAAKRLASARGFGLPAGAPAGSGAPVLLAEDTAASGDCGAGYHCAFLDEATHACGIYERRPLDCMLYPLMLVLDETGTRAVLHLDGHCPVQARYLAASGAIDAAREVVEASATSLACDPNLVADDVIGRTVVSELPRLSAALSLGGAAGLARLRGSDRERIERANERGAAAERPCYARSFAQLFCLRGLHGVLLADAGEHLVVVAVSDGAPWFPVAPLGPALDAAAVARVESVFASLGGRGALHLPSVRECDRGALEAAGFTVRVEGHRVVASRDELVSLSGAHFRAHRNLIHRAESKGVTVRPATPDDTAAVLELWQAWCGAQPRGELDAMTAVEAQASLRRCLDHRALLGVVDLVAEADDRVVGYTAGAPLAGDSWVVTSEFALRSPPGVPQLLARELARAAAGVATFDLMDDSGAAGVARAKARYGRSLPVLGALKLC